MDLPKEFIKRLGYMWYIMDPREHMYSKVEDVPDYYKEIIPAYFFLSFLELGIRVLQGKGIFRLNDTVVNISTGIIMELTKIPIHGFELLVYTWVYSNWRLCTMPWDSVWTWLFALVISDLSFYWIHRASHQISILWVLHQTHHNSEDFNLTTPFRLNMIHSTVLWITYLPLALAVPPPIYFVHFQLNVIFQFWLHTEIIKTVGFLEYIFVTPSHHRVHHGRNRRCIDKNFGSVFILWDKLFGTFEPEGDKPIAYGVTKPLQTFSPVAIQFDHMKNIWYNLKTAEGFANKLSCFFKGPGWSPGKPWFGNIEDIPEQPVCGCYAEIEELKKQAAACDVTKMKYKKEMKEKLKQEAERRYVRNGKHPKENEPKYDPQLALWLKIYIIFHTVAMICGHFQLIFNLSRVSTFIFSTCATYIALTTFGLGYLLDLNVLGPTVELVRCFLYIFIDAALQEEFGKDCLLLNCSLYFYRCLFLISSVIWMLVTPYYADISLYKSDSTS